jgi:hypothetical protein
MIQPVPLTNCTALTGNTKQSPNKAVEGLAVQSRRLAVEGSRFQQRQWQSQSTQRVQEQVNDPSHNQIQSTRKSTKVPASNHKVSSKKTSAQAAAIQLNSFRHSVYRKFDFVELGIGKLERRYPFPRDVLNVGVKEWDDLWKAHENIHAWDALTRNQPASAEAIDNALQVVLGDIRRLRGSPDPSSQNADVPAPVAVMTSTGHSSTSSSKKPQMDFNYFDNDTSSDETYNPNVNKSTAVAKSKKRSYRATRADLTALPNEASESATARNVTSSNKNKRTKVTDNAQDVMDILEASARPLSSLVVEPRVLPEHGLTQAANDCDGEITVRTDQTDVHQSLASSSRTLIDSPAQSDNQPSIVSQSPPHLDNVPPQTSPEPPLETGVHIPSSEELPRALTPKAPILKHESIDPREAQVHGPSGCKPEVIIISDDDGTTASVVPTEAVSHRRSVEHEPANSAPQAAASSRDAENTLIAPEQEAGPAADVKKILPHASRDHHSDAKSTSRLSDVRYPADRSRTLPHHSVTEEARLERIALIRRRNVLEMQNIDLKMEEDDIRAVRFDEMVDRLCSEV